MKGTCSPISMSVAAPVWRDQIFWFAMVLVFVYAGVYNCLPITFQIFKHVQHQSRTDGANPACFFRQWNSVQSVRSVDDWPDGTYTWPHRCAAGYFSLADPDWRSSRVFCGAVGAFCFGLAMTALSVIYSSLISKHFGRREKSGAPAKAVP